jgi:hypothetical protein
MQFELLQSKGITVTDLRIETIKAQDRKPLVDAFQLVGIS